MNNYAIKPGDTLTSIAGANNTSIQNLLNLNPTITDANKIYAGNNLNLGLSPAVGGNSSTNVVSGGTTKTPTDVNAQSPEMQQYFKDNPAALNQGNGQANPYIGDSSAVTGKEDDIKTQLNNLFGSNEDYNTTQKSIADQQDSLIQAQQDYYKQQLDASNASINAGFDESIADTKSAQEKELASNTVGLARIGGYLGGSVSASAAITSLQLKHTAEINKMQNDRYAALQAAQNAVNEKQYNLALDKLNVAKDYAKNIDDRNSKFFDNYLALTQSNQSASEFMTKQADDLVDKYVQSNITPTADQVVAIAKSLNTDPEVITSLITAKQNANALQAKNDKSDQDIKVLSVLKDIPKGQYVKIGDQVYSGLKAPTVDTSLVASSEFDAARKFINDNIDSMTPEQFNSELRQKFPKLSDGDIASLQKERGVVLGSIAAHINPASAETSANKLLTNTKNDPDAAKKLVDGLTTMSIDVPDGNGKTKSQDIYFTNADKQKIKDAIDAQIKKGPTDDSLPWYEKISLPQG